MRPNPILKTIALAFTAALAVLTTTPASAVPAFAQQTGLRCQACHIGGLGPQLTQFGRSFKMNGYTQRVSDAFTPPVSAMAVASFVNTAKDQAAPPADHYGTNNNVTLDEASIFLAGGIGRSFRRVLAITYDGRRPGVRLGQSGCARRRSPHDGRQRRAGRPDAEQQSGDRGSVQHAARLGLSLYQQRSRARPRRGDRSSTAATRWRCSAPPPMRNGRTGSIPRRASTSRRASVS